MNLQSPTTLLSSIQLMKNKLRTDKQTLMEIKNDFTKFNKKANPHIEGQQSATLSDITKYQSNKQPRSSNSIDKHSRNKIIQLKKQHQRQINRLKEQHEKQLNQLLRIKKLQIEDVQNKWRSKLQQQSEYITTLEDQITNSNLSQNEKTSRDQYDQVIKKLVQDNNRLCQETQRLKQEANKWKSLSNNSQVSKNRFRFAKGKRDNNNLSNYQTQRPTQIRTRAHSVYNYNNQNFDHSNILANSDQWQDIQINDDEGKLKTIRQFQKQSYEDLSSRRKVDAYKSLNI